MRRKIKSLPCPVPTAGGAPDSWRNSTLWVSSPHSLLVSAGAAKGRAPECLVTFLGGRVGGRPRHTNKHTCTHTFTVRVQGPAFSLCGSPVPGTMLGTQ